MVLFTGKRSLLADNMGFILLILISAGLLSGLLYILQPSMVFYPYLDLVETPAAWGLEYEEVYLSSHDGVRLHGWYIPRDKVKEATSLIVAHLSKYLIDLVLIF